MNLIFDDKDDKEVKVRNLSIEKIYLNMKVHFFRLVIFPMQQLLRKDFIQTMLH